jgi:hypothetical protein
MPCLPELDRPDEDFVVIHATPEMNAEAATLLSNAAYARFERAPGWDAMGIMACAIATISGALPEDFNVTDHFPEPFMVRFIYPHHRTTAVSRQEFTFEGHRIHIRPWRLEDGAEQVTLRQHVRLCIESLPLYAWTDAAAQQVIGRACSVDYIEDRCKRREYTKALCLWAWVEKPALVPRVHWVTLLGPPGVPGVPEHGRRGLQRRCIIYLDIMEDMRTEDTPMPSRGTWGWGLLDGERTMRDRSERIQGDVVVREQPRRDGDGDNDRDRRGRGGSREWRETICRSLSRGDHSRRGSDGGYRDQRRERDRFSNRQGELRHAASLPPSFGPRWGGAAAFLPGLSWSGVDAGALVAHAPVIESTLSSAPDAGLASQQEGISAPVAGEQGDAHRGRSRTRSTSPRATRRRSRAQLTPPSMPDPPSSPIGICPSSPTSKGSCPPVLLLAREGETSPTHILLMPFLADSISEAACRVLHLLAPSASLASRPPGFGDSPAQGTPPFLIDGDIERTPEHHGHAAPDDVLSPLLSLFREASPPLVSAPPPPRRVASRRKTLAGVDIQRTYLLHPARWWHQLKQACFEACG